MSTPAEASIQSDKPRWTPPVLSGVAKLLIAALAVTATSLVLWAWDLPPFFSGIEATENAYVRGRTVVISPQVNGYVTVVEVTDYQSVSAGQVLARVDDRIYQQRVAQARAQLAAQQANLANYRQNRSARTAGVNGQIAGTQSAKALLDRTSLDLRRLEALAEQQLIAARDVDQAKAAHLQALAGYQQTLATTVVAQQDLRSVDVARNGLIAAVDAAMANLRLAEIDLEHTVIRAPEAGRIGEVGVRLGQYVVGGTQLMAIVPDDVWVIAQFKEAQTARIFEGQPVRLTIDGLEQLTLIGRVQRIAPAAGSEFAAIKIDTATGNFIKIPQRIGVRIAIEERPKVSGQLRPGMSVRVEVDTRRSQADSPIDRAASL